MSLSSDVNALRKLGHFLASLFPSLGRLWDGLVDRARARLPRRLARLDGPRGKVVAQLVEQFLWSRYKGDRVDWGQLDGDGARLLRPIFLAGVATCIALPLALALPGPSLPPASVSGATAAVPLASVALWLVALPLAWGRVLAGAAGANLAALVAAVLLYLYFQCAGVVGPPPSWGNAPAPLAALLALAAGERHARARAATRNAATSGAATSGSATSSAATSSAATSSAATAWRDLVASLLAALAVGGAAGVALAAFTPLGRLAFGHKLAAGLAAGAALGVATVAATRRFADRPAAGAPAIAAAPSLPRLAFILAALTLAEAALLVARAGLATFADDSTTLFRLIVGQLWPVWYFVGVSAIFGLLKTTRLITGAAEVLLPERWLLPLLVAALAAVAVVALSGGVATLAAWHAPGPLLLALAAVKRWTTPWVWGPPAAAFAAEWVRWLVAFDVAAVAWLAARRRLSTARVVALGSHTLLAWLCFYEYHAQLFGLARGERRSATLLFVFAVWLLWLLHKLALKLGQRSSPRWPSAARLAIAGGLLLLVLLAVEARAAIGDRHLSDEIFLYLFRGIVDVGLPYFLYVYAGRKLARLPLATHEVLGAFCLGALATLPLAAADHRVGAVAWPSPEHALPPAWLIARASLAAVMLTVFTVALRRRRTAAGVTFAVVAAALGLASFTTARLELPLIPTRWATLVSADSSSLAIDANLLVVTLGYALAGLIVGLGAAAKRVWLRLASVATALAMLTVLTLEWPRDEAWLRASGVGATLLLLAVGLLLLLIMLAHRQAMAEVGSDDVQPDAAPSPSSPPSSSSAPPSETWPRRPLALAAAAALALVAVAAWQARAARAVPHALDGVTLPLAPAWQRDATPPTGTLATFHRDARGLDPPRLLVSIAPRNGDDMKLLLQRIVMRDAPSLPGFAPGRLLSWQRHRAGTLAFELSFTTRRGTLEYPLAALLVLTPLDEQRALALTLIADFESRDALSWDLARTLEALRQQR